MKARPKLSPAVFTHAAELIDSEKANHWVKAIRDSSAVETDQHTTFFLERFRSQEFWETRQHMVFALLLAAELAREESNR